MPQATFRTLSEAGYWQTSVSGQGLLVTGKGYPDLATRSFLYLIHSKCPEMPIFALTDFDPDGVNIMRCYRHGSRSLDHEENITVPEIMWLGVKSDHILDVHAQLFDMDTDGSAGAFPHTVPVFPTLGSARNPGRSSQGESQGSSASQSSVGSSTRRDLILPLTTRDRKCAIDILNTVASDEAHQTDEMETRRQIQVMLMMNYKGEIQAVDDLGDLTDWLDHHLCSSLQ
jgi:meiotic recombination protein SPO11